MATINILGNIGESVKAEDVIKQIQDVKDDHIKTIIASPGGSAFQGLMVYDALKNSGKKIKTVILGLGASAASVIFMAGDEREMAEGALLMVHNSRKQFAGTAAEVRKQLEALDAVDERMKTIFMREAKMTEEKAIELLSKDSFMNFDQAKSLRLATSVIQDDIAACLNPQNVIKEPSKMADDKNKQSIVIDEKNIGLFARLFSFGKKEPKAMGDDEDHPNAGPRLASLFSNAIDEMTSEERPRATIISAIASAANISEDTVNQIVSGDIDCPPENRLSGFSEVLNLSMESIMEAWSADGCTMPNDDEAKASAEKISNLETEIAELKASIGKLQKTEPVKAKKPEEDEGLKIDASHVQTMLEKIVNGDVTAAFIKDALADLTEGKTIDLDKLSRSPKAPKAKIDTSKLNSTKKTDKTSFDSVDEIVAHYNTLDGKEATQFYRKHKDEILSASIV